MMTALLLLGILFLGYYFSLQMKGMDFSIIWLIAGVMLVLAWYALAREPFWVSVLPRAVKAGICVLFLMGFLLFAALEILILHGMGGGQQKGLDYIIVLGAQVRGDRPSRALRMRIDTAADCLRENPSAQAVLSGGQGPGEDMTEAQCMRNVLVEMGISEDRLILEDRSTSTWENLEFSARLVPVREAEVGLVTQNFHVYRSVQLARRQQYKRVSGIAAPAEFVNFPHFMVREAFALVKEKLVGNL